MNNSSTSADLAAGLRALLSRLRPGDRLPSSRELVREYRVGPATVARAIAALAAEGAVVTRPGSGTFKAPQGRPRDRAADGAADTDWQTVALTDRAVDVSLVADPLGPAPAGAIAMDGGYVHPSLQPTRALSAALARAARHPQAWERAPAAGLTALRTVLARTVGAGVAADDVLVTAGGQSALSIAFRAIAGPGSPVLVESPTYPLALAAARAAQLRPVPVPIDADGLRPDMLADAFAMTGARLLYCQPTFQNPTGAVLAPERRRQVLDIARAAGAFVIEDDFARHLGHGGPVPRPLIDDDENGTVVHVTSLTKPTAPSMRIGALVARGPVMERMRAVRLVDDFFIARPLQEAASEVLSSPSWDRHVRTLGAALRERCAVLAAALAREAPGAVVARMPTGGLHLWVRLPPGADDARLAGAARMRGVAVSAGGRYFATESPAPHLRIGFAATADLAELTEGARRLGAALAELDLEPQE
ncbi:PLP-dependent aminotransferase family protein [Glycomyces sp. TRM65418]|uniref:aminotransferase-like domain-containing protein n=1 Tax=Glycomyces sp. TRM65418 TaxID=2867006 RepID=UPI001CE569FB|nr:PLP-dependent aminotransferase family protein [Glycomyces sp. TRM65418]MCC3763550.1 PLP-dependent aminotransferase family protein [Glycomyces sp. TRM65418]QZD57533.1 PLP-dependent aminotransferase family protein [Glycomyces sp. TRM65418]